jgi:hypothetical protein
MSTGVCRRRTNKKTFLGQGSTVKGTMLELREMSDTMKGQVAAVCSEVTQDDASSTGKSS